MIVEQIGCPWVVLCVQSWPRYDSPLVGKLVVGLRDEAAIDPDQPGRRAAPGMSRLSTMVGVPTTPGGATARSASHPFMVHAGLQHPSNSYGRSSIWPYPDL
jgi:hypothetical protein